MSSAIFSFWRLLAHQLQHAHGIEFFLAARPPLRIQRCLEKRQRRDARNLNRVLQRQEHALGGARIGRQRGQIFALIQNAPARDLVTIASRERIRKRRFARAVRSHDGVHFARRNRQRDPFQDLLAVDRYVQVVNFQ
jgi:hypothetical protein